jgi:hypothetical protein
LYLYIYLDLLEFVCYNALFGESHKSAFKSSAGAYVSAYTAFIVDNGIQPVKGK